MATTTYRSILDAQLAQVESTAPTDHTAFPFRRHREKDEFEVWAELHPNAAFRRFDIRRILDEEFPEVSNTDVEEVTATQELLVAYPMTMTGVYQTPRDRDVLMDEDKDALRDAVGISGYANYTNAAIHREEVTTLEIESVLFLRLQLTVSFYRSV